MRHYCDRCPARAKVVVDLLAGPLNFCQHHYDKHEDVLLDVAVMITTIPQED